MNRRTEYEVIGGHKHAVPERYFDTDDVVQALAAYEDTGLSPADVADLTARAEAAEADLRKCAPCWLCKKKCGIFDALDQRKDGCCHNFEWRGPQAGKEKNDAEK